MYVCMYYIGCVEPIQQNEAACNHKRNAKYKKMNETATVNAMFDSRNDHHRDDHHHHYRHRVTTTTTTTTTVTAAVATTFMIERNEFCVRM